MFGRSTRSDVIADGCERPRKGRGLGRFTGSQLTTIIVALVVVIGFPFAASAVTGQNVFLTDTTSGKTAKVDAGGHVLSTVSGAVSAVTRPAAYSQWKRYSVSVNSS